LWVRIQETAVGKNRFLFLNNNKMGAAPAFVKNLMKRNVNLRKSSNYKGLLKYAYNELCLVYCTA
jgi:hypothetical protein